MAWTSIREHGGQSNRETVDWLLLEAAVGIPIYTVQAPLLVSAPDHTTHCKIPHRLDHYKPPYFTFKHTAMSDLHPTHSDNQTILQSPVENNYPDWMDVRDNETNAAGWTLPHCDFWEGLSPVVQPGAGLEALNSGGDTTLISAVVAESLELVRCLLAQGADVNHADPEGWTPLHCAVLDGSTAIIKLLVQAGADLEAFNPVGQTALISAVHDEDRETVELLLALNANVNHVSQDGWTPLHFAILARSTEIAAVLIDHGADREALNPENETPLMSAVNIGDLDTVKAVLELGADVNGVNEDRWTALHFAAKNGSLPIIMALAHAGAAIEARNSFSETPLMVASQWRKDDFTVLQFLVSHGADLGTKDDEDHGIEWYMTTDEFRRLLFAERVESCG